MVQTWVLKPTLTYPDAFCLRKLLTLFVSLSNNKFLENLNIELTVTLMYLNSLLKRKKKPNLKIFSQTVFCTFLMANRKSKHEKSLVRKFFLKFFSGKY